MKKISKGNGKKSQLPLQEFFLSFLPPVLIRLWEWHKRPDKIPAARSKSDPGVAAIRASFKSFSVKTSPPPKL